MSGNVGASGREPTRIGRTLAFDPFDTYKRRWFLRASQRLGWPDWILYLIVCGIRANVSYLLERRRDDNL